MTNDPNQQLQILLKMNVRIRSLEARLAAARLRQARPSPAAASIALVGLAARLKLRQLALREHIAKQDKFQQFADRLNALRLDRGLTFEELGARACIPAARVQAALHGDLDTEFRDLVGLCLALKVRTQITLVPSLGGQPTVIPIGHSLPKDKS